MKKLNQIHDGKAKKVFATDDPDVVLISYKDSATSDNGLKRSVVRGKGIVNNRVTNHVMKILEKNGIPTHYIEEISDRETLVKKVDIIPVEVVVRNVAAGSLSRRFGLPEGTPLKKTVIEHNYINQELNDPMVSLSMIVALGLATEGEIRQMDAMALKTNEIMKSVFKKVGIDLVDFKLEFGRTKDGKIVIADEISPDTCRMWDSKTREKLDKDRFRNDMGSVEDAYKEIGSRLLGE